MLGLRVGLVFWRLSVSVCVCVYYAHLQSIQRERPALQLEGRTRGLRHIMVSKSTGHSSRRPGFAS